MFLGCLEDWERVEEDGAVVVFSRLRPQVLHSPDDEAAAAQHSAVGEMAFALSFQ